MTDPRDDGLGLALPTAAEPKRRPVSIERSVDEGVIIARAAVTMEVKNYIIVGAIREDRPFDIDEVTNRVRHELLALATENNESANRVQGLAVEVQTKRGAPDNSEGYQTDDHPTLTKRGIIHVLLAAELERLSEDVDFVADIAEGARVRAWAEVGEAIESRLLGSLAKQADQFYEDDKDARIRALFNINFRALERQAKRAGRRVP